MSDIAKQAGVSRQAVYLHFNSRAELLIAATHHLDDINGSPERLIASRIATTGTERLATYITAWSGYLPDIYGMAKAFLAMQDSDEAVAMAWRARMQDMKEGCAAAINALAHDRRLSPHYTPDQATDILWTMLSVRNWEQLTVDCDWSHDQYTAAMIQMARDMFVIDGA